VGHWYPIVFIDFHKHVMNGMMVLRQGYALVFGERNKRKEEKHKGTTGSTTTMGLL